MHRDTDARLGARLLAADAMRDHDQPSATLVDWIESSAAAAWPAGRRAMAAPCW